MRDTPFLLPQGGYLSTSPRWVKVTKTFTDFSITATSNEIEIYTLPIKGIVHFVQTVIITPFSGGGSISATVSVGLAGDILKYQTDTDIFTGAILPVLNPVFVIENDTTTTTIKANVIVNGCDLDALTTGEIEIYLMLSQLPS